MQETITKVNHTNMLCIIQIKRLTGRPDKGYLTHKDKQIQTKMPAVENTLCSNFQIAPINTVEQRGTLTCTFQN